MTGPPPGARQFNKLAVRLAGRRYVPLWVVLHHRGRTSGTEYAVPLAVIPTASTFVIGLPWGQGTDWVRNVRVAGGCTVRWKGADYTCTEPTFVGKDVALAAAHGITRRVLQRGGFPHGFLQLTRSPTG